jgi:hypothetical protein
MAAYFSANNSVNNNNWQLYKLGDDQSVTQWTAINNMGAGFGFLPLDPTSFNNAVWYDGNSASQGRQLYRLLPDGSFTLWTAINPGGGGLFPDPLNPINPMAPVDEDLTVFNNALWFDGRTPNVGNQLYKLGNDGSVTLWTAVNTGAAAGLDPGQFTEFNGSLWFDGNLPLVGRQLFRLEPDGSVIPWSFINPGGGGLQRRKDSLVFQNDLWFGGAAAGQGNQLYKLGFDNTLTRWTAINPNGGGPNIRAPGFDPLDLTAFASNVWIDGIASNAMGAQLYKLGFDGSVTQWTAIPDFIPRAGLTGQFTVFQDAMWFTGNAPGQGAQLYKLGNDGSVTQWTAINPGGGGLSGPTPMNPMAADNGVVLVPFANALWFGGNTADGTNQLFKLGFDGSVTQWTATPGGFNPIFVGDGINTLPPLNGVPPNPQPLPGAGGPLIDTDSTAQSIFQNAAWLQGRSPAGGTELFKLGADGSVTEWKDINPGPGSSFPYDWSGRL